jgi:hypothetical protein
MDSRVKGLWLDALRSGEYKQAKEMLAKVNPETEEVEGFCCLGVLCDLAVKEGVIPSPVRVDKYERVLGGDLPKDRYQYGDPEADLYLNTSTAELPEAVRLWAGLDDTSPSIQTVPNPEYDPDDDDEYAESETISAGLAELNDDHGYDFSGIADLIEAEL